jgi:hypothetical protein
VNSALGVNAALSVNAGPTEATVGGGAAAAAAAAAAVGDTGVGSGAVVSDEAVLQSYLDSLHKPDGLIAPDCV